MATPFAVLPEMTFRAEAEVPPTVFPVNSVKAMRACIWLLHHDPARFIAFTQRVFERYWHDDQDVSQDAVLTEIATDCGIDASALGLEPGGPCGVGGDALFGAGPILACSPPRATLGVVNFEFREGLFSFRLRE